ncbi:DUF3231 family protein [Ureibacillus sp. 179-F W5.1 NHS]|uniref:DUF3231 family protein n=1 Tax=Ureibacillus sp. 179-F W5.1 NHS TaxID=3374297 RepID=UPI0038795392
MGIMSRNPKEEPLHYGEVFTIWSNVLTNNGMIAMYQTLYNHTGDRDLAKLVEEAVVGMEEENKQLTEILKVNGVGLPPVPPERPNARLEDIPVGAKYNDPEISAIISGNVATGLVACSTAMGKSTREDIAAMYGQFHMAKAQLATKLLRLNKSKGWLVPPPLHIAPQDER